MQSIKVSLADMASQKGCTKDFLLALAETEQIDLLARIGPFSAEFRDRHDNPVPAPSTLTRGSPSYTVLLPHEVAALRNGQDVTIRVVRDEGAENGYRLLPEQEEECLYWLLEPQTIGIDQVFANHDLEVPLGVEPAAPHANDAIVRGITTAIKELVKSARNITDPPLYAPHGAIPPTHEEIGGEGLETQPVLPSSAFPRPPSIDKKNVQSAQTTEYLATVQELIDAFECDPNLFENAHKFSWVKDARKVKGKGGKNSIQAKYDPHLFAENLPGKKHGKGISKKKAWAILETKFPERYDEVAAFDPRN